MRAPEHRYGTNNLILYIALVVLAVVAVGAIVYVVVGRGSSEDAEPKNIAVPTIAAPIVIPTAIPLPATPVPAPASEEEASKSKKDEPKFAPDIQIGEVLSQGFVGMNLPGNYPTKAWYTFQIDTTTREITVYFAVYDSDYANIVRTVQIDQYTEGEEISNAQLGIFYDEGPARTVQFNRAEGTITMTQNYAQPFGPSLFSPDLRVALVNQRMSMQDASANIATELQLDLTGLSDSELILFKHTPPDVVKRTLSEIQSLLKQIEDNRVN